MKNLLVAIVVILAVVGGIGFYRGWFQVSTAGGDNKSNLTFTVDQDKLRDDEKKLKDVGHRGSAPADKPADPKQNP
jgi:hypothetical protein